jgi:hypothetical protein
MTIHAIALLAALLAPASSQDEYKKYFDLAEKAKSKGEFALMEQNLELAFKNGPGDEYAWRSLAWAQMHQGKWKLSLVNAQENIRRNGESTKSLMQLFSSAVEAGDLALAKNSLDREARLPQAMRNSDASGERADYERLTKPVLIDMTWKITVKDYEVEDGVIYLQAPLRDHLWQKCDTTVEGAKEWKQIKDGRWDVLVIKPGDAAEVFVKSKITHTPRILGWRKLQSLKSWTVPDKEKPCLGKFINSTKYDPADPQALALAKELKGATPAETVQNILDWQAKNMRYEFGFSDELSEMLKTHRGVCHHYSNFIVTIARAAGVPAVVAHGSHYPDRGDFKDCVPSHGWAEVYLSGMGWVPIDPLSPNTLRAFRAPGYVIVDTSGYAPDDNHFYMKMSNGKHLQSIQGAPGSGTCKLID